jgi:two-component system phosphate regulon sensor histidine kinase PhoR
MAKRIFLSMTALWLSVLIAATIIFTVMLRSYSDKNDLAEMSSELVDLAEGAERNGPDFFRDLPIRSGSRILWIAKDGTTILSKGEEGLSDEIALSSSALAAAFASGNAEIELRDGNQKVFLSARRLDDGSCLAMLRYPTSYAVLLRDFPALLLLLTVLAILITTVFTVVLTRRITRPFRDLDPSRPESIETDPEIRPMIDRLILQNRLIDAQIARLERNRTEFSAITENMNEGLLLLNSRAEILSCNESARQLLGIPDGSHPSDILALNPSEELRRTVREGLMGERSEVTIRRGDASHRILCSPVQTDGISDGAVILILDETEKESREALRREFTANVSHELKTPLTSISGFAELIASGMAGESAPHFAGNIVREAARLLTLVNDILRLSQLDEGSIAPDPDPIPLLALARSTAERYLPIAEDQDISLQTEGEERMIRGNSKILSEMLSNLIDNGIKYGKKGGHVTVTVGDTEGRASFSVADDGIGIPSDQLDRIFERFYRVDKSHSKEIGGTGLGLSIVKRGAIYHHARINIRSTPEVGTVITVLF